MRKVMKKTVNDDSTLLKDVEIHSITDVEPEKLVDILESIRSENLNDEILLCSECGKRVLS